MKRLIIFLTLVLCSCSKFCQLEEKSRSDNDNLPELTAAFSKECETRTYVENSKYLFWHENDCLAVFFGSTLNRQYKFNGKTGDNSGTFSLVPSGELGTGNVLDRIYALYPYNADTRITDDGIILLTLPAIQTFAEDSFGVGANTMVAVTENLEDTFLSLRNTCGYLKLKLYNTSGATLKSLEVKGNNGEKIAGDATLAINFGDAPSLIMAESATGSVLLDCGEGIALGTTPETATELWIVLPVTTFSEGLTITATDIEGLVFEKSTSKRVDITRNEIQPMAALEAEFAMIVPETWKIYYTATAKVEPADKTVFGANYVSNDWNSTTKEGVIIFDGEVTTIGQKAFYACNSLTSIKIPSKVTIIGNSAFYACINLKNITLPDSVTAIYSDAFNQCGLTSIIIPDKVESIATSLFSNCSNLASVVLSKNITAINNYAFNGCYKLKEITIPSKVTTIGNRAFTNCGILQTVYCNAVTPPTLGSNVFPGAVTNIYVPTTSLDAYKVSWSAYASKITTTAPVGNEIWYTNGSTTVATEPNKTGVFGAAIKSNSYDTTKKRWVITFDANISSVGDYAFCECRDLISVVIPEGVTSIGDYAFANCRGMTSVTLPDGVTSIGENAFEICESLSSINIPEGVTSIGQQAFYACGLTSITLPASVNSIGSHAFYYCTDLENIVVAEDNSKYDSREGCNAIIETDSNCLLVGCCASTIPNGVTSIGASAFSECEKLTEISIPDSVTSIGVSAFEYCSNLTSVYIGKGVTLIDARAFNKCLSLKEVYCYAVNPPTLSYQVFAASGYVIEFNVPAASVDAYKEKWSDYAGQIWPID